MRAAPKIPAVHPTHSSAVQRVIASVGILCATKSKIVMTARTKNVPTVENVRSR